MKPSVLVSIAFAGLAAFIAGVPVSEDSSIPSLCPSAASVHGACSLNWYACGTSDKKPVEGGKTLLQCNKCGIWDIKTDCKCSSGSSSCKVWGKQVRDDHNTVNHEFGACKCDAKPSELPMPPTTPDTPGESCSTVSHRLCATNDKSTVMQCGADHIWKVFKKCANDWCCRYSNHGYPDCYEQCDPHLPPRTGSSDGITASIVDSRNEDGSSDDTADAGSEESTAALPTNTYCAGSSIISCNGFSCATVKRCPQKCCMSNGRAICCSGKLKGREALVTDDSDDLSIDSSENHMSESIVQTNQCTPGHRSCAKDGLTLQSCDSTGHWKQIQTCGHSCFSTSTATAHCVYPRNYFNARAPAQAQGCTDGEKHCGSYPGEGKKQIWCTMVCQQGRWIVAESCQDGSVCKQVKGQDPMCVAPPRELKARSTIDNLGSCSPGEENQKKCGSEWWAVICRKGRWVIWKGCQKGHKCGQKKGEEPKCATNGTEPGIPPEIKQPCRPGTYICSPDWNNVLVCNHAGIWKLSSLCGRRCCKFGDKPGTAFCDCREDSLSISSASGDEAGVEKREVQDEPCTPGTFTCNIDNRYVLVCNAQRVWVVSSDCRKSNLCCGRPTPGIAYCYACPPGKVEGGLQKRQDDGLGCVPGHFSCTDRLEAIKICTPEGKWVISAQCGLGNCCAKGAIPNTRFCKPCDRLTEPDPPPKAEGALQKRQDRNLACVPGTFACLARRSIMICMSEGRWKLSAYCGSGNCCTEGEIPNTRFCKPCDRLTEPDHGDNNKRTLTLASRNHQDIGATSGTQSDLEIMPPTEDSCAPGTFMCYFWGRYLRVCDAQGIWQTQGKCSEYGQCCHVGPTGPQCVADTRAPLCDRPFHRKRDTDIIDIVDGNAGLPSKGDVDVVNTAENTQEHCNLGDYKCSKDNRFLLVCGGATGWWQIQGDCSRYGQCCSSDSGKAICVADERAPWCGLPNSMALSMPETQPQSEPIKESTTNLDLNTRSPLACTPGTYRCSMMYLPDEHGLIFIHEIVQVCAAGGQAWALSADCDVISKGCCTEGPTPGTAFCQC